MNDFTKEELNFLYKFVYEYIENYGIESSMSTTYLIPLAKKLESLRDNYCEHNETFTDYNYNPERCKFCFEFIEE